LEKLLSAREMGFLRVFDRFLMIIYTLGVIMALFVLSLIAIGWTIPMNFFRLIILYDANRLVTGMIIAFYLILSIKFFLQALIREKSPPQAVVYESGLGQVRVSAGAVENLVHRVAGQMRGIKEVKPRIICRPEGLDIFVRVALSSEANIPKTSEELQNKVRDYMSEVAGINVRSVKILVDTISADTKPGMQRKLL
jgi:uncharacterized alkaline shock family protein YloU